MNLKLLLRRAAGGALCLLLCLTGLAGPASADAGPLDTGKTCSLTATYRHVGKNVFLYRVAGMNEYGGFKPEKQFEDILSGLEEPMRDLNKIPDDEAWIELSECLDLAILEHNAETGAVRIEPYDTVKTVDAGGEAVAKFEGLPQGLYLVMSERYGVTEDKGNGVVDTIWYSARPYLVSLPGLSNTGEWVYNVTRDAGAKMSMWPQSEFYISVQKIWLDSNGRNTLNHPNRVTLNLLKDGAFDRKIELDESGWSKVVGPLDSAHRWDIVEERISGWTYKVVSSDGRNFVVENRRRPTNPGGPDDPPDRPPDEVVIEEPDVPLSVPPLEDPDPPDEIEIDDPDVPLEDLPQTGQLWWPVPLLAVGGMFLLLLGWGRHRRGRCYEE